MLLKPVPYLSRALLFFWGFYYIKSSGKPVPGSKVVTILASTDQPQAPIVVANHVSIVDPFLTVNSELLSLCVHF